MADTIRTTTEDDTTSEFVGKIAMIGVLGIAVVLGIHPFGFSDLYDDGLQFLDHVTWYWMTIHVIAALLFLTWPPLIDSWASTLSDSRARLVGRWAHMISIGGVAVGTIHLVGTDTMTFWAFRDTYDAAGGSEAADVGADVLLRLHAATLSSWVVIFFFAVPLLAGAAALMDERYPRWVGWLGVAGGALQAPALLITISERQWTTVSEQFIFRTGATLFIAFMLAIAWSLRRGAPVGTAV